MFERKEYVVLIDFEDDVPLGVDTVKYAYQKGQSVHLKPHGRLAKKWTEKGYVALKNKK